MFHAVFLSGQKFILILCKVAQRSVFTGDKFGILMTLSREVLQLIYNEKRLHLYAIRSRKLLLTNNYSVKTVYRFFIVTPWNLLPKCEAVHGGNKTCSAFHHLLYVAQGKNDVMFISPKCMCFATKIYLARLQSSQSCRNKTLFKNADDLHCKNDFITLLQH